MERGGPTVQAGIAYQNGIAALYLGDLLSFDGDERDRVVEVRVEAPAHVDDIVVHHADGHRRWVQVKLGLKPGTAAWDELWPNLNHQRQDPGFAGQDRLHLIVGDNDETARLLQGCAERTGDANEAEWRQRLSKAQANAISGIEGLLGASAFPVFSHLDVVVAHDRDLGTTLASARMPPSSVETKTLHALLTSVAGGGGRRREVFRAPELRARLREHHGVRIDPPRDWGLKAYLDALVCARIAVPGTSIGGAAATSFAWPRTARTDEFRRDFDDEQMLEMLGDPPPALDLRLYPAPELTQAIVHAGPGFGKSALLTALAQKLAAEAVRAPAIIPLAALAESKHEVLSYLNTQLNADHEVRIDWSRLCETGAAVIFFDGLDEVPLTRRSVVIARLERFMSRHRQTPWLLTVRDPAHVPAKVDAQKIELLPLLDSEMRVFIRQVRPEISETDLERLIGQLEAYSDLRRLARIPLFLALLVATQGRGEVLPSRRSDLIEAYLKTLFRPEEHKDTHRAADPERLRDALQGLAFALLQSGTIGADERDVRRRFAVVATDQVSSERFFDDALRCGVLRRQTSTRLTFPFPIVQEYLAAQELVERHSDEIAERAAVGVDRPWAQAIQFALERMPDASGVARDLLAPPDDAFASTARLLARCIVNGMDCASEVRGEVGERLITAWPQQSYWTRKRIGQLLRDGWSSPPPDALRAALHRRDLFHDGAEEILGDLADDELTLSVLRRLNERPGRVAHLGEFQRSVNRVSEAALTLYVDGVRGGQWPKDDLWVAATLIRRLDGARIPVLTLEAVAADTRLPTGVRLATLGLMTSPPTPLFWTLALKALRSPRNSDHWPALTALGVLPDAEAHLADLLRRDDLHPQAAVSIVEHLKDTLETTDREIAFLRAQAADDALRADLRQRMRVRAANLGDRAAFEFLLEGFADLPSEVIRPFLWSVNKAPDRDLGERLVAALRARPFTPGERTAHIRDLLSGATHDMQIFSYDAASMNPAPPHPAYSAFVALLAEWRDEGGFELPDQLYIEAEAVRVQLPGAAECLLRLTAQVARTEDLSDKDGPLTHPLIDALRRLTSQRLFLPLADTLRLTRMGDYNGRTTAIDYIAARGTREALDVLLGFVGRNIVDPSSLLGEIEMTATRLGLKIVRRGEGLVVAGA